MDLSTSVLTSSQIKMFTFCCDIVGRILSCISFGHLSQTPMATGIVGMGQTAAQIMVQICIKKEYEITKLWRGSKYCQRRKYQLYWSWKSPCCIFWVGERDIFFPVACLLSVWSIHIHALSKNAEEPLQRMLQ